MRLKEAVLSDTIGRKKAAGSVIGGRRRGRKGRYRDADRNACRRSVREYDDTAIRVYDEVHSRSGVEGRLDRVFQVDHELSVRSSSLIRGDLEHLTCAGTGFDYQISVLELVDIENCGTIGDIDLGRASCRGIGGRNGYGELLEGGHFSGRLAKLSGTNSNGSILDNDKSAPIRSVELLTNVGAKARIIYASSRRGLCASGRDGRICLCA